MTIFRNVSNVSNIIIFYMQGSDYDGYRPLLYACKHDKMFIVEWLLNETKANTNVHTQV